VVVILVVVVIEVVEVMVKGMMAKKVVGMMGNECQ
jgi:hypothetical protein